MTTEYKTPLVVSYGMGVDSTAVLVGLHNRGVRPDLILFADTGSEKQETYDYLDVINAWLDSVGFPRVTIVKNVVSDFKHWPPYSSLEENCLTNGTLPSLAFGFKSCSLKWKVAPQNKFTETWAPAIECWARGLKVRKIIGYDAGAKDRKRYAVAVGVEDPKYTYVYPLIGWRWDRERCKAEIREAGLPVPPKSACYHCPATQPEELHEMKAQYLRKIVIMEARAEPRLDGHIPQEEHDRRYEIALAAWKVRCSELRAEAKRSKGKRKKALKLPKPPRRGCTKTGVQGLWRSGNKGTKTGTPKPGSMTVYIRDNGLLPAEEIEALRRCAPKDILDNQAAFADGLEIPSWHDFLEAYTAETFDGDADLGCVGCVGCSCE